MNTQILTKCVEELKKESPNLSYILGMLETVIALSTNMPIITTTYAQNKSPIIELADESINSAATIGPLGRIS